MKRIAMIVAVLATATMLHAQERKWHLESEVGFNVTHYINYPALSALQDNTEGYTGLTSAFNLGLQHGEHAYYGLRYENTNLFTSNLALDERTVLHNLSLAIHHTTMLTEQLELQFGATLGLAILHNTFAYGQRSLRHRRHPCRTPGADAPHRHLGSCRRRNGFRLPPQSEETEHARRSHRPQGTPATGLLPNQLTHPTITHNP